MTALRLLPELEDALRSLPGVQAVSIVTTGEGVPTEVHVLALPGKAAKQIVRDVQSLALVSFEQDIDHRIISVVQIGDLPLANLEADGVAQGQLEQRREVAAVGMLTAGPDATATVSLRLGTPLYDGSATGSSAPSQRLRLTALATLEALREPLGRRCDVESVQVVDAGASQAALVVLTLQMPRVGHLLLCGSALVRIDAADAVARSVLNALNRQLTG